VREAKAGDTVDVHYTGTLDDGVVFDSSVDREPLSFAIGAGQVIAGFDRAVTGLKVGESRVEKIQPEDAYGIHRPDMIASLPREHFPDSSDVQVGQTLELHMEDGNVVHARVASTSTDTIDIDANHPLAGKTLTFEFELVKIH